MTLHTLASGSEGNCLLVRTATANLLVDAGISYKRIAEALSELGLTWSHITAVLLTHGHSDHTAALATLCKRCPRPLYATQGTAATVVQKAPQAAEHFRPIAPGDVFSLGDTRITVFPTAHDAWGSVDFRIDEGGYSVGVLTDTGYVTGEALEALRGVGLLVLESNHDPEWLWSGPYPPHLKERIAGRLGHLSNAEAGHFAVEMARHGTKEIVLAHLSHENNTPRRALDTVERSLLAAGLFPRLSAAPRRELSRCYEVEERVCNE